MAAATAAAVVVAGVAAAAHPNLGKDQVSLVAEEEEEFQRAHHFSLPGPIGPVTTRRSSVRLLGVVVVVELAQVHLSRSPAAQIGLGTMRASFEESNLSFL